MMRSCVLIALVTAVAWPEPVGFNRDIRPILSDRCYACHATDAAAKGIRLRLDREDLAKADLGGRRAIVAGDPGASAILTRIRSENRALRMPPVHTGPKLADAEIALIEQWIREGAKWERHWAFIPPVRPAIADSTSHPIDAFVRAKLTKAGLTAAPRANAHELIRRATLDLTGLPPTPEEADEFARNPSREAYSKVLDRLLASDAYAERMTIRWLDASRYADTNGYQTDADRIMWRWRDWVIDAYRANMPFDRFITEQIAGDLLPGATRAQRIATGFQRNHRGNSEGGIVPEEYLVEYAADRVETMSTVFLGLTLGCSRCHNHKYDPFTQKEYYQLMSFVDQIGEPGRYLKYGNSPPLIEAPTPEQERRLTALERELGEARSRLTGLAPRMRDLRRQWERTIAPDLRWALAEDLSADLPAEVALNGRAEVAAGDHAEFGFMDRFTLSIWVRADSANGVVFQRMNDLEDRPDGYGIHLEKGRVQVHFAVRRLDDAILVETKAPAIQPGRWHHIAVTYDGSRYAPGVKIYVDGKLEQNNVLLDALNQDFRRKGVLAFGGGGGWPSRLAGAVRGFRAYSRDLLADEVLMLAQPSSPAEIAKIPEPQRSPAQQLFIEQAHLALGAPAEARTAHAAVRAAEKALTQFRSSIPTVMVMDERSDRKPTRLLNRGVYDRPGDIVARETPQSLHAWPAGAPRNRLGLAQWLTSKDNPLTARVTVNRYWQMLFGTGLVKTAEDFGSQGEWPSHPEMLDWLAVEFVESGWDTKRLLKTIMMSDTYQQSSIATAEARERDPDNRLLARGPRVRLTAEMVRDQALAASGLLVRKVGGPSVFPYQPAGLWADIGGADYRPDKGEGLHRRSLYTFWKRTAPPPFMATFDSALREACTVREGRTNTPLQALHLMNDVQFLEPARELARRAWTEASTDEARLERAFRLVAIRAPRPSEKKRLLEMLATARDRYRADPTAAAKLLVQGEAPDAKRNAQLDAREHAAWMVVASLVLNLDAAMVKE